MHDEGDGESVNQIKSQCRRAMALDKNAENINALFKARITYLAMRGYTWRSPRNIITSARWLSKFEERGKHFTYLDTKYQTNFTAQYIGRAS